ncbi:MAG: hypothetical protein LC772_06750 [Chloroflexi bacterium]|nr:hypothetical protein [Chloroflexota bacterium]
MKSLPEITYENRVAAIDENDETPVELMVAASFVVTLRRKDLKLDNLDIKALIGQEIRGTFRTKRDAADFGIAMVDGWTILKSIDDARGGA